MIKLLLPLIVVLATCTQCFSQVTINYVKAQALVGAVEPQLYTDAQSNAIVLLADAKDAKLVPAALITVETKAKLVQLKARLSLFEFGNVTKVGDYKWLLVSPTGGKYAVEATTFDATTGIEEANIAIDLGPTPTPVPPGPGPTPPGPTPPGPVPVVDCNAVPADNFNNIGKRSCEWASGLPKRKEVGLAYEAAADRALNDQYATINTIAAALVNDRTNILGTDLPKYSTFIENVNADLKSRWPLNKADFAAWASAVSKGLENGQ